MTDPKIIYIVTDGDYSDYTICALFSMKEDADAYVRDTGSGFVEEWDLDTCIGVAKVEAFGAEIICGGSNDGKVTNISYKHQLYRRPNEREVEVINCGDRIIVWSPVSADHAMKCAIEKRQEKLREAVENAA